MSDMQTLTGWLNIGSLAWSLFRIALVWLAFHGTGYLIGRIKLLRKNFWLMPPVIFGMLGYLALAVALSLLGLLTRTVVALSVAMGAIPGFLLMYERIKKYLLDFTITWKNPLIILAFMVALYIMVTDLMLAGRPEINFNDTQVTYLVQPDRWLNHGRMYFLDETVYSAFPVTSEMLLLFPSSLAHDRLDQMILGQVFSLSMVFALVISAMSILKFRLRWYPVAIISIGGCSTILLWCHFAKPDAFVLFFVTVSLSVLLRQIHDSETNKDMSAFLVMGIALGTKFTAYLSLIPFAMMFLVLIFRAGTCIRDNLLRLFLLSLFPVIFAVRSIMLIGSPFFPHAPFDFLLRPEWRMPDIELTYNVFNDRSSYFFPSVGFWENIYHYFGTWNSSIYLLLCGYLLTVRSKFMKMRSIFLAGILLYAAVSLILFYPAWWGAKYGILLIPFATVFGLYLLRHLKRGFLVATLLTLTIYFVYDSPLSPTERWGVTFRNGLFLSYLTGEWDVDSRIHQMEPQPELRATLWMNHHIPVNSTILSFYQTKRYFSNHRWINAWRYPPAAHLYLENSIDEEIEIAKELGVDYIIVAEGNPAPFDDENRVELLSRIGRGNVLVPVASIDGHMILRFDCDAISDR